MMITKDLLPKKILKNKNCRGMRPQLHKIEKTESTKLTSKSALRALNKDL